MRTDGRAHLSLSFAASFWLLSHPNSWPIPLVRLVRRNSQKELDCQRCRQRLGHPAWERRQLHQTVQTKSPTSTPTSASSVLATLRTSCSSDTMSTDCTLPLQRNILAAVLGPRPWPLEPRTSLESLRFLPVAFGLCVSPDVLLCRQPIPLFATSVGRSKPPSASRPFSASCSPSLRPGEYLPSFSRSQSHPVVLYPCVSFSWS